MEKVILVDEKDRETGQMEKLEAHRKALLHRAISVLVFNSRGELLLQQRALHKYHSAGLWSNTCCSHPRPGESNQNAARRRLKEEMGMECGLTHRHEFIYKAVLDGGLTEHEYDHVFIGYSEQIPQPDPEEVMAFRWVHPNELKSEMQRHPEQFTYWFRLLMEQLDQLRGIIS